MKSYVRTLLRRIACALRPRTLVLVYHHVWNPGETLPWITTPPDQFTEHMALLSTSGMATSLDELLADLRAGQHGRGGRVVVTFDDATEDTLGVAFPILRRYGVPATIFVPTGLIGTNQPLWWNRLYQLGMVAESRGIAIGNITGRFSSHNAGHTPEIAFWQQMRELNQASRSEELTACAQALGVTERKAGPGPMTWEQIEELDASRLITLGAHTVSHPMLSTLTEQEVVDEVFGCRDALARFASFRKVFAYPYGDPLALGDKTKETLRRAGFEVGFTTEAKAIAGPEDHMALGRVSVDNLRLADFRWLIDHYLSH
jgi:peptidoglycan/xylan/chitin deacetylase (PgdA/CDA1 family)